MPFSNPLPARPRGPRLPRAGRHASSIPAIRSALLLIRHAEPAIGEISRIGLGDHVRLSAAGHEQARALVRVLANEPIVSIQSSMRLHCIETAEGLAEAFDLPVMIEGALDEIDPARQSGVTIAATEARVSTHLRETFRRYPHGCVVMITHAQVIRAALSDLAGLSDERSPVFDIAPASITRVDPASLLSLPLKTGVTARLAWQPDAAAT